MEFEEMQKVWDEQKGENMYIINESALHRSVTCKKDAASKRINHEEVITSLIIGLTAIILIIAAFHGGHNWAFISSGIMAIDLAYIQYFRWKRKKAENKFDRTLLGELDHTILNTNSVIRFYVFMIIGFLIPLCSIYILKMFVEGATLDKGIILIGVPILCVLFVQWILKKLRGYRKRHLLDLRKKLTEE